MYKLVLFIYTVTVYFILSPPSCTRAYASQSISKIRIPASFLEHNNQKEPM